MALGTRAKRLVVGPKAARQGRSRCVPSVLDTRATDCTAAAACTAGVEDYTAVVGTTSAVVVDTVAAQRQHH